VLALILATALSQDGGVLELGAGDKRIEHLGDTPELTTLKLACFEDLTELPAGLRKLTHLRELIIDNGNGCQMNPQLPEWLGELRSLETLTLYGTQAPFTDSKNPKLRDRHPFPKGLSQLKSLTALNLGNNGLHEVPAFVKDLPHLRKLNLDGDSLKAVPDWLGQLKELQELSLFANDLTDLPRSLEKLPALKRIGLGNNCVLTHDEKKMAALKKRFPKVELDFQNAYDCPQDR
jgi:Leucine-rich repeat (LRR) protein